MPDALRSGRANLHIISTNTGNRSDPVAVRAESDSKRRSSAAAS